jgi:hypothetical protein
MKKTISKALLTGLAFSVGCISVADNKIEKFDLTYDQVFERTMHPFTGQSNPGVDTSTLHGKVMCGYQGWFTCPGDGSGMGWFHWGKPFAAPADKFQPGVCSIDLWPEMDEYKDEDKFVTSFKHANGSAAYVYSAMSPGVADLHFKWMKEYGIDGAFVQRFAAQTFKPFEFNNVNIVLANCRAAANKHGRTYVLMYDLTGTTAEQIDHVIGDIKLLVDKMGLAKDPADKAYLHHNGKPVIAIWGVGFNKREYDSLDCARLIKFLKTDKRYGGFTVMLGIPTYWRQGINDALEDKNLKRVMKMADIVSPWTIGRIRTIDDTYNLSRPMWSEDIKWCNEHKLDYLPVVFPGFSWYNMYGRSFNLIPRLKGDFLWKQFLAAKSVGAKMVYVAMFDEVDEATAIYKCTNNPPVGQSKFITYEGLPSDHYLWLAGQGGKLIRGDIPVTEEQPDRK